MTSRTHVMGVSLPWVMVFFAAFYYFFQFIIRTGFGVMTDELMQAFDVDACQLGILSSCYYNAYAAMQIPTGLFLDRFGPRRVIAFGCLLAVSGVFIFAVSHNLYLSAFGRFLMGAGTACGFIGTIKMATLWLPLAHVGRAVGLTMFMGTLGANFAATPMRWLVETLGWRQSLLYLSAVGFVLSLVFFTILRDKPVMHDGKIVEPTPLRLKPILEQIGDIMARPQVWYLALFGMIMYAPLAAIADLWGPAMMASFYGLDKMQAAFMISFIYIGVALGSPTKAYLAELKKSRKYSMAISLFMSLVVYAVLIYIKGIPQPLMYLLLFLAGFSFGGQNMVFASISESLPLKMTGLALGFLNMVVMFSGVIFQPLVGKLLASTQINGTAFMPDDFRYALIPIPLTLLCALWVWGRIKETFKTEH